MLPHQQKVLYSTFGFEFDSQSDFKTVEEYWTADQTIQKIAKKENVTYIDLKQLFFKEKKLHVQTPNGDIMHRDKNHINVVGSRQLGKLLLNDERFKVEKEKLQKIINAKRN